MEGQRAPQEGSGEVAIARAYEGKGVMLHLQDARTKLPAQRRELFRQAAQTEEDLLWFETDLESEAEERGQTATTVRLLDHLDERMKGAIEAIDRALMRIGTSSPRLKGGFL